VRVRVRVCRRALQYVLAKDAGAQPAEDTVFRLPADYALREADVFRRWAELYARDAAAFTRDFQRTYQRAMQVRRAGGVVRVVPGPRAPAGLQLRPTAAAVAAACCACVCGAAGRRLALGTRTS
jgi:acyl-CoA reductase-like NAD-dependent aldehyde dehydrogenase